VKMWIAIPIRSVGLKLLIDETGAVSQVELLQSIPDSDLNEATIELARRGQGFGRVVIDRARTQGRSRLCDLAQNCRAFRLK